MSIESVMPSTISSLVIPFSSCLQSFPTSGSFPMSQLFRSGGQVLELQLQHQSFQWISCEMSAWMKHKLESRLPGEISITSDMQMTESEEELKSFLMRVKEQSEKSWLKTQHSKNEDHGIWSHHSMANRWGNSGNSVRLYFLGLQNHCRWWLQAWN